MRKLGQSPLKGKTMMERNTCNAGCFLRGSCSANGLIGL